MEEVKTTVVTNDSKLAQMMLDWQAKKKQLDDMEEIITKAVKARKKTFITGNVTAKYISGRRVLDYENAAKNVADQDTIQQFTTLTPITDWEQACQFADVPHQIITQCTQVNEEIDWKKVCEESDIEAIVTSTGDPSVKITVK